MSKKKIMIPRDANGSIPHYPYDYLGSKYTYTESAPFKADLELLSFSRGRSAANFNFVDKKGAEYTVFMVDLLDMIKSPAWKAGKISGTFEPCKRGMNYGIKLKV